jgi:polyphosphate glucokinase
MKSPVKAVLAVDVGVSSVKILATGQSESRSFSSGPTLTPRRMVSEVKKLAADWMYDVVSIGYPGPVLCGRPIAEPFRLWEETTLSRTPRLVPNDAHERSERI